ncbi:MAG: hypothetical protein ACM3NF_01240 [Gemmatimonadota bacterium]
MRRRLGTILLSLLLLLPALPPACPAAADNVPGGTATYEQRAAAERASRSRYRDLEVGSLVFILLAGGGILFWALRRR